MAGLNGIRFQTECARLVDRSTQMKRMLDALRSHGDAVIAGMEASRSDPAIPAGRTMDVLHLAENCSKLTLDEVPEWSFV